jgi:hypothetical protein
MRHRGAPLLFSIPITTPVYRHHLAISVKVINKLMVAAKTKNFSTHEPIASVVVNTMSLSLIGDEQHRLRYRACLDIVILDLFRPAWEMPRALIHVGVPVTAG